MRIKSEYTLLQKIRLIFWVVRTKLIFPAARIIRFPFDVRGKKMIQIGCGFTTGTGCRIEAFKTSDDLCKIKIVIGNNVQINDHVHISALQSVKIGDNVLMAGHVYISDNQHGSYELWGGTNPGIPPKERNYLVSEIVIEENVWIGEGVIILPGVTVGYGCIIGAHSVVNKSIPRLSMAVGSPARVVKFYDEKRQMWVRAFDDCK